ncbi:MAG: heme ABC exporter ATP-binding protein CcmA [Alphaproteobacteria bacterium]
MHLKLHSLSCRRGGRLLFERLSAELGPGTMLTVRGPNGSGKSSLLRILAGFLEPESGQVRWKEKADESWREEDLEARTAYLGHANGVKSQLTVAENLQFWAALAGAMRCDPYAALSVMGLEGLEDMQAGLLSAGQQRRLALCRLPLTARPLWLLDEPEAALDTASRAALAHMISDHLAQGGLTLAASHGVLDVPDSETLTLRPPPHTEVRA